MAFADSPGFCVGMFGTLFLLFVFHRRQRDEEREKRVQYWREQVSLLRSQLKQFLRAVTQNAFRQNIMQMRDTATSILSSPHGGRRGSDSSREHLTSIDSHAPILQNAAPKGSGLRHYMQDDDDDDSFIMEQPIVRRADGKF
jgi:hypothetical protein